MFLEQVSLTCAPSIQGSSMFLAVSTCVRRCWIISWPHSSPKRNHQLRGDFLMHFFAAHCNVTRSHSELIPHLPDLNTASANVYGKGISSDSVHILKLHKCIMFNQNYISYLTLNSSGSRSTDAFPDSVTFKSTTCSLYVLKRSMLVSWTRASVFIIYQL